MAEDLNLTDAEKESMKEVLGYSPSGGGDGKHSVHSFLHNVVLAEDTTKLGYLKESEIGEMNNPIRAYQFLASFSRQVMNNPQLEKFFLSQSEIGTATSLSRDALLLKLAVTQKRELSTSDVTKTERKPSSSWFKPKKIQPDGDVGGGQQ